MEEKQQNSNRSIAKARSLYLKAKADAEAIINLEPDPLKWNKTQLKTRLVPLKQKSDGAYPSLKAKLLEAYMCCKERVEPSYEVEDNAVLLDEGVECNGEDVTFVTWNKFKNFQRLNKKYVKMTIRTMYYKYSTNI